MSDLFAAVPNVKSRHASAEARAASSLVLLDDLHGEERRRKRLQALINSWPVGVGILLALCAPTMSEMLGTVKPWGMWLVFPFVALSARPELHLGSEIQQILSQAMLFLQFPLEGLIAKKILKTRITLSGVAGQIFLYHFLGVVQLWLVCRALGDGTVH
jgi:hypothetical protein